MQACRQLELTLLHMLEKQGSLKVENANLLTEIQSLQVWTLTGPL